ncbi:TPA: outer membrane beta-barrel protein [Legionella pneumophila]|nr:outer membrane beta-barrel protein [Legionella pneumophila]HAT8331050.1 outer membrane beta-barrel protein [Legionella pneumophila]
MNDKYIKTSLISLLLSATSANAGSLGPISSPHLFHPMISVFGGINLVKSNYSQTLSDFDGQIYAYNNQNNHKTTGLVGVFLGEERALPRPGILMQTGIEYSYLGKVKVNGVHAVGYTPASSTLYTYSQQLQSQQLLAVMKLLTTVKKSYHPYAALGLGVAINKSGQFNATTNETGSINLTPRFDNHTHKALSYNLGLGVDKTLSEHLRMGLGYRFTDLGKSTLGYGQVSVNNFTATSPFTLSTPHTYVNQFIAQVSYIA